MTRSWKSSIRARYTVAAAVFSLIILGALGATLDLVVRNHLQTTAFDQVERVASQWSATARGGVLPRPIPAYAPRRAHPGRRRRPPRGGRQQAGVLDRPAQLDAAAARRQVPARRRMPAGGRLPGADGHQADPRGRRRCGLRRQARGRADRGRRPGTGHRGARSRSWWA
ncbi:hypothetical protein [Nonomuraea salmonea]|uniref:hypothetical protein n=1 Tax=Nonomuraea salmonea TaxID=46181 RepID=UPI0031E5245D